MSARTSMLVALGVLLPPACHAPESDATPTAQTAQTEQAWRTAASADGTWRVRWRSQPEPLQFLEPGRLVVEAARADGTPATELRVDAGMPQHGHGLLRRMQVEPLGEGRFAVGNVYLHMPGAWVVYLDLGRDGVFERLELELEVD